MMSSRPASLLCACLLALVPATAMASLEAPPVTLAFQCRASVTVGRPFLVTFTVASDVDAPLSGLIRVDPAPMLEMVSPFSRRRIDLPPRSRRSMTVAVRARGPGIHEIDLVYGTAGSAARTGADVARLRLFVRASASGGDVLSFEDLLHVQALEEVQGPDEAGYLLFPLRAPPAETSRPMLSPSRDARGALEVTGQLFYAAYGGGLVPGRRIRAELWARSRRGARVLTSTEVAADGSFRLSLPSGPPAGSRVIPVFTLRTPRWSIQTTRRKSYAWEAPALTVLEGTTDLGALSIPAGQAAAEACWIHSTLNLALDLFERNAIDVSWWPSIPVQWPASGDFFAGSSVNLTQARQWDVAGHELGHAIFHHGSSAASAGGSHRIDECYSKTLAWSEGWASYFSAMVHLPRDAEDAAFEYLVPRRAPIRVENVPADVCQGQTNEWRVAAALWDVYDTHSDGDDACAVDFPTMWQAMREGNRVGELKRYAEDLKRRLSPSDAHSAARALQFNTIR